MSERSIDNSMKQDAFSKYHPAVNLLFFAGAVCLGALFRHPAYLIAAMCSSLLYFFALNGLKALKTILVLLPTLIFITFINPLLNTRGNTVLFLIFKRPYTLEALIYGAVVACIFFITVIWVNCFGKLFTADRIICLFGNILPNLCLLLAASGRILPKLIENSKQIATARSSIGKGGEKEAIKDKLALRFKILSALTSVSLENSIVTGDSMKARGFAAGKRTSFKPYRMTYCDWLAAGIMTAMLAAVFGVLLGGFAYAEYFPGFEIAEMNGRNIAGVLIYSGYLLIPSALQIKEKIRWSISRYGI